MDADGYTEGVSSETLDFGVPAPIASAIKRAAQNELISKSAYARRAVVAALQRDGFLPDRAVRHAQYQQNHRDEPKQR